MDDNLKEKIELCHLTQTQIRSLQADLRGYEFELLHILVAQKYFDGLKINWPMVNRHIQ